MIDLVERLYFALGCGLIQGGEAQAWPLLTAQEESISQAGLQNGIMDTQVLGMIGAAKQRGRDRASRPGECQYWGRYPMELSELRQEVNMAMASVD